MLAHESAIQAPRATDVRTYLADHQTELTQLLSKPNSCGLELALRHTRIVDQLLGALYTTARKHIGGRANDGALLLAAVGGYGRGCLGLKSDLDVRLLTADVPEATQALTEALLYPLWDAGVSIGHQVVTVSAALSDARDDLPTATALLDWRPISGDVQLGENLIDQAYATLFSASELPAFLARLEAEVDGRHRRFGDSVYLLEPDVKNGVGGLRDLDIALWAARARWRVADLDGLAQTGVLLGREAAELRCAADFLWALRNHLHHRARRRSDRLTFDEQEVVSQALGYRERIRASATATAHQISGTMVEAFMSDYYRHARVITRARERILTRAAPQPVGAGPLRREVGAGLVTVDGSLSFSRPDDLPTHPALAFRLYDYAVAHGSPIAPDTRDQIVRAAADPELATELRRCPEAARTFVRLVCTAQETHFRGGSILAELHEVGLLLAMIPEFAPVVGRVHHDVYHVYTVDVHSVAAVDRLRALMRGDLAKEHPLACRVAAEVTNPRTLFFATLLHDVGKAIGGKEHSRRGARMAVSILRRLGLTPDETAEACYLILQHLVMYRVAVRRDLQDPATLTEFLREIHGGEGLRNLYLLTVVDLATTSPTSMTKWKSGMLDELFRAADAILSGKAISDPVRLSRVRSEIEGLWPHEDREFLNEFLDTMPERYFLANAPAEIVAHAQVALRCKQAPISAAMVPSRHPDVAELCVVTPSQPGITGLCVVTNDRPGLLAAITAAIVANRLEIYAAQIHSRKLPDGGVQAVDLFWVRDRSAGAEGVGRRLDQLETDLNALVDGQLDVRDLLTRQSGSRWSERPSPSVSTDVLIENRSSCAHTVIEVLTKDRPGILYTLAETLHRLRLTISVAKINTEGTQVADVFYVSEADGSKIASPQRIIEIREAIFDVLRPMNEGCEPPDTPVSGIRKAAKHRERSPRRGSV